MGDSILFIIVIIQWVFLFIVYHKVSYLERRNKLMVEEMRVLKDRINKLWYWKSTQESDGK